MYEVHDSNRRFVGRSPLDRYVSIAPYLVIAYILVKNFCIKGDGADKMKCSALTTGLNISGNEVAAKSSVKDKRTRTSR